MNVLSLTNIENAVNELGKYGFMSILVKGGHFEGDPVDYLFTNGTLCANWTGKRCGYTMRGTGCRLASFTAARLAQGDNLLKATKAARRYVQNYILKGVS
ncbi:hydroxymethylpyrimidine/phosphomethylpyrimidine kinase [bacterium]|nr:hydroxymethylpyrimidine/phosphomethylpyrimidine kinase [bacterium]